MIGSDDRGACGLDQIGEQPQLGGEIALDRGMIVEMVAAEIGKCTGRHSQAVETILVEPVRGGLDGKMGHALPGKLAQGLVQGDRIGRGQRAIDFALRRDEPDRADAGRRNALLRPDLAREGRDRSFPARAGDSRDHLRRAGKKLRRCKRERPAHIAHPDPGYLLRQRPLGRALRHDCHSARRQRLIDEAQSIVLGAGHRDEQIPRLYPSAVGAYAGKVERGETCIAFSVDREQTLDQIPELHLILMCCRSR